MIAQCEFSFAGMVLPPSPAPSPVSVETEIKALGGETSDLTEEDISDFNAAEARILDLMQDGNWYPDQTIIHASQQREGLRRLRNLRKRGYVVEKRRVAGCRAFEYRISKLSQ